MGLTLLAIGYAVGSTTERRRWQAEKAAIARDVLYLKDYIKQLREARSENGGN